MRLNVLVLIGVFVLLAGFYGRQQSPAQHAQGMSPGTAESKKPIPTAVAQKPGPPASQPQQPATSDGSASKPSPEVKPTTADTKPSATDNKPAPEVKPATPAVNPPPPAPPPPAPAKPAPTPPTPVSPPNPAPANRPQARPLPPPPKPTTGALEKVAQSKITIRQIVQALQNYFRDTARYPTMLTELGPKYISAVPIDPCTNQPYYYIPVNAPPTTYILTTGRFPTGSLCRSVIVGLSYSPDTGMQNSP